MSTELVRRIAYAVIGTTPTGAVDVDDLIQVGTLGLLEAKSRYDAAGNADVPYEAWLAIRIRGAMIDELRSMDWMSRDSRKISKKVSESQQRLTQQLGRTPTESEVSSSLGVTLGEYRQMQDKCSGGPVSLDTFLDDDASAEAFLERFVADYTSDPLVIMEAQERSQAVADAIRCLSQKEQLILSLTLEDLNNKEIAQQFSLSEARISQIRSKIVAKLQHRLAEAVL